MRLTTSRVFIIAAVFILFAVTGLLLNDRRDLALSERAAASRSETKERSPLGLEELSQTFIDPATGAIPPGIRNRELEYARTLPKRAPALSKSSNASLFNWASAGPNNRAGRTRGLIVDVNDPNNILAGGVSSGVWKSTDGGASWVLKTTPGVSFAVTTIAQDPRAGQTNTWYFAGGEFRGGTTSSDRGFWAPYMGAGIFKSTDNGETWQLLPSTRDSDPTSFNSAFDYVHRLAISPTTGTVFVANNASGIYRSADGGASFPLVLGGVAQHAWGEVTVGSNGVVIAILSQQTQGATQQTNPPGVYKSTDDGLKWMRITPATFPSTHHRSLLAVAPSNPDIVYALTFTGQTLGDGREDMRFHKINLATGAAEDRSANLPRFSGTPAFGAAIHAWFNFCMVLAVKPDDENFVIAGGTTLFRSSNGFASPPSGVRNETHIGGYGNPNSGGVYANHYVDQQNLAFHPSRPNELWSANDGGVFVTRNVTATPVVWENKNRGYISSQFYAVAISARAGDEQILSGAQDDGILYALSAKTSAGAPTPDVQNIIGGDGSYCYLGERFAYSSLNFGDVFRHNYTSPNRTGIGGGRFISVPPQNSTQGRRFVHYFAIDPADERVMLFPIGNVIYRNTNIEGTNPTNTWTALTQIAAPNGYSVTAMAMSQQNPEHVLYFGVSRSSVAPRIYRWENAHTTTSGLQEISVPNQAANTYVHSIAVNPLDANEILVVFSNYNIVGLYHSLDGGQTYTAIEGNLTGTSANPGPSLRAARILPLANVGEARTIYFVATSTGLFSTTALNGANTIWEQEAADIVGHVVAEHIVARASDGRVAVGTLGRGMLVGDYNAPTNVDEKPSTSFPMTFRLQQNYPNPFNPNTRIAFELPAESRVTLKVFDVNGRAVSELLSDQLKPSGHHQMIFAPRGLASGAYFYELKVVPLHSSVTPLTARKAMSFIK
jgi:hypothetical protein